MNDNILALQIEPLDTLFFRDGKPFSMGDDTWAEGIFPPAPSVIYGAIRSWILANDKSVTIENIIKETADLEILDLYYQINGKTVLPLPLDYVTKKEKDKQTIYEEVLNKKIKVERLPIVEKNIISSVEAARLFFNNQNYILETIKNAFITVSDFSVYLNNKNNEIEAEMIDIKVESKIGIKRTNETLASEDGKLYRVGLNRFNNLKFIVRIKSKHLSENYSKLLKFGGEGKIVVINDYLKSKKGAKRLRIEPKIKTDKLLVYLATPSIFHNSTPDISQYIKTNAKLLGQITGKGLNIGGFDMKKKRPKTMYKAVPAGSIFLYKLNDKINIEDLQQGIKISDEMKEQGFGITYFGTF